MCCVCAAYVLRMFYVCDLLTYSGLRMCCVWGVVQPQKTQKNPNPKWDFKLFLGFLGFFGFFLEKGVESTFLNIPDHLRPTCFLHFFKVISPSSDT